MVSRVKVEIRTGKGFQGVVCLSVVSVYVAFFLKKLFNILFYNFFNFINNCNRQYKGPGAMAEVALAIVVRANA